MCKAHLEVQWVMPALLCLLYRSVFLEGPLELYKVLDRLSLNIKLRWQQLQGDSLNHGGLLQLLRLGLFPLGRRGIRRFRNGTFHKLDLFSRPWNLPHFCRRRDTVEQLISYHGLSLHDPVI